MGVHLKHVKKLHKRWKGNQAKVRNKMIHSALRFLINEYFSQYQVQMSQFNISIPKWVLVREISNFAELSVGRSDQGI